MKFQSIIEPVAMFVISVRDAISEPSERTLANRLGNAVELNLSKIAVATLKKGMLKADDVGQYLLTASGRGDVPLLSALVETGVNVNGLYEKNKIENPFGMHATITNALITALQGEQEAAANFLLDKGARADSETFDIYSGALTLLKTERTRGKSAFAIAQKVGFNSIASRIQTAIGENTVAAPKATANSPAMS